MANLLSFIIFCVLLYGRSLRFKNLKRHIQIVQLAMAADILLVAGLVVFRKALGKVSMGMPWTLQIHIPIALTTILLYGLITRAGYRLRRGDERARPILRDLDKLVLVFRSLTLVTSLMVQFIHVEG
jgi:hypothetical protein